MVHDPSREFYIDLEFQKLKERVDKLESNQLILINQKALEDVFGELKSVNEQAYNQGKMKYQCGIQKALEILKHHLGEYL